MISLLHGMSLWHRNKRGPSTKDLRHAAALLIAAAGVKLPASLNVTADPSGNISIDGASHQYSSGVQFMGLPNVPALKELARVYEAGMLSQYFLLLLLYCPRLSGWRV